MKTARVIQAACFATGLGVTGCVGMLQNLGTFLPQERPSTTAGSSSSPSPSSTPSSPLETGASPFPSPNLSADLSIATISVSPTYPSTGNLVRINASIVYCCKLTQRILIDFFLDGARVDSKTVDPGGDRGEAAVEFTAIPRRTGRSSISIVLDPANTIEERFETNNLATASLDVWPNLAADLNFSFFSVTPNPASVGNPVTVSASVYYCCNPENPIEVELDVDGLLIDSKVKRLGDRGTESFSFTFTPSKKGKNLVSLILDPSGTVPERFETNNVSTTSIEVQ